MPNVEGEFRPVEVSLLWDDKKPANQREVLALKSVGEEVQKNGRTIDDLQKSPIEDTDAFQETISSLDESEQVKVRCAIRVLDSLKDEVGAEEYKELSELIDEPKLNVLQEARTPDFEGTASPDTEWSAPDLEDYWRGWFENTDADPDEFPDDAPDASELPRTAKNWIASLTLLGDPDADNFRDLRFFPIVDPITLDLNRNALEAVIGGRGSQADISGGALNSAQSKARDLLESEFDIQSEENQMDIDELLQDDRFSESVKNAVKEAISEDDASAVEQIKDSDDLDEEVKEDLIEKLEEEEEGEESSKEEGEEDEGESFSTKEEIRNADLPQDVKEQLLSLWDEKESGDEADVQKLKEEKEEMEKRLKRLEDEKKQKEFTQKYADEFSHLPIEKEEAGKLMKSLDESLKEETYERLEKLLKSADEVVKQSEAFDKLSKRSDNDLTTDDSLTKEARELSKEEDITVQQAKDKLLEKHPEKFADKLLS